MRILYFVFALVLSTTVFAQRYSITGQLIDTLQMPLPSATVMLLNQKDSSLVNFGASNAHGIFEIRNVVKGNYFVKVSYVGFANFTQKIEWPAEGTVVTLGKLQLQAKSTELDEVVIKGEAPPVTVKRDTIEFNAPSFKVAPNSSVEELLKRLPGVEVESDGTVKAQGETVQRVTVDGKEFFGRDPKIATRNLPADAIQKIQVFDRRSDQALFTGIDDGQREKTINLELKEKNRNAAFGNVLAGYGTDDRYQGRASINKFSKGNQLSFLGMANNINEQGFSIQDYMNFSGGLQQLAAGGGRGSVNMSFGGGNAQGVPTGLGRRSNGIMTNYAGGLNFNKTFNKKTELNGSYFLNHLDHNVIRELERENFLPNGNFNFLQSSIQQNNNTGHRLNTVLDHKIDSANSLRFTSNLNYNLSTSDRRSMSSNTREGGVLQNESEQTSLNDAESLTYNGDLLMRHRFRKKGRTLSANLLFRLSQNYSEGLLLATNKFYVPFETQENIRQENTQDNQSYSYGTNLSFTEALGNRIYLELNYNFIQNLNSVDRQVYDVDSEEIRTFNAALSNKFESDYQYHRPGFNLRMNRKNFNVTAGASMQQTRLRADLLLLDATIDRSFQNFLPVVRFNYNFSSSKSVAFDYETSVQEPSIQQLQPVIDNNDPLNIYVGNPDLKPSFNNRWIVRMNLFDPGKFISLFTTASVNYMTNPITNEQSIDDRLIRTTRPVNVDDGLGYVTNATMSFPITKLKSRFNIGGNFIHNRFINLLNEEANVIRNQIGGGNARYTFNHKDFDFTLSANLSQNQTKYEFDTNLDQLFFNQNYTAEINWTFLKDFHFNTNYNYQIYESVTTDFRQTIPFWNVAISRFFLKNKSGELKFAINNIFDQDLGVQQRASVNYFEREVTNSLGRFYMLSFTYAINRAMNPLNMRRGGGGGGMRMMQVIGG
ncbi:MAG TPA: outer membrane beta-barrel protein [Cyclobacteriaceae bacterium]|nr:outer membrane beta-barrel protein [Cyclobacteriaceae bacterium]